MYKQNHNYRLQSNVDSNWKTCARENTVRVFFFRLDCMDPFKPGDPLSDGRSGLSGPSSSIISCPSSSESLELFMYDECSGDDFVADGGGLSDGDGFSVVFVDELSVNKIQIIKIIWDINSEHNFIKLIILLIIRI